MLNQNKLKNLSIILLLFLGSCTCNYHIKKVKGKCGIYSDTVYVTKETIVPKVERDTVFNYFQKDTVIIREGRLTMRYFYNNTDSTVYLQGECDTIKVVQKVPVAVNTYKPSQSYWYWYIIGFLLVLILLKRFKLL